MWEVLVRTPLGRLSMRKFIVLLATLAVVSFGYLFATAPVALAAGEATWKDGQIIYNKHTYEGPVQSVENDPSGLRQETTYYTYKETPEKGFIIYFTPGTDPPTANKATLASASFDNGKLISTTSPREITVKPSDEAGQSEGTTSCAVEGIGWIICPVSNFIANGMDLIYGYIQGFLEVKPLSTSEDQAMYRAWSIMRDFANVAFVIGFLILIYGQISGGLLSNYTIKKMLPRVIVAAILVNISYWICAIAVDISNILGYAIQDLFVSIRNSLVGREGNSWDLVSWESFTSLILSGGSAAAGVGIASYLGLTAVGGVTATAGAGAAVSGLVILLLPMLIGLMFIILITFLILAARQAIITVFIILAPFAFVAYLLPNTEKWFDKWRGALFTLLLLFPAFSVIFGGSQLAASIIIQNATSINMILLAMAVQVAPLAITPLLLKLGGGVLNRFANIVNNPTKGVFDRGKNWARERTAERKAAGLASLAMGRKAARADGKRGFYKMDRNGNIMKDRNGNSIMRRTNGMYAATYRRDQGRREREGLKSANEAMSEGLFSQTRAGRQIYETGQYAGLEKHKGEEENKEAWAKRVYGDPTAARGTAARSGDHYLHSLHEDAHLAGGRAKVIEEAANANADRKLQEYIRDTPGFRDKRIQTSVDAGLSESAKKVVDAQGSLALKQIINDTPALAAQVEQTVRFEKQAAMYESIVQKAAEQSWSTRVENDQRTRQLYLQSIEAEQNAKKAEQNVTKLTENVTAMGNQAPTLQGTAEKDLAQRIKQTVEATSIIDQTISSAKIVQQRNLATALKENAELRTEAAGVDALGGENRVLAAAKKAVSDELIKATNNFQDTLDYDIASNPVELAQRFRSATDATEKIVYARLMARNAPGLIQLKDVLREYTSARDPEDDEVMLLKEVLAGDDTFRNAGRDMEVWANNERKGDGTLYDDFEDVQNTISVINNISADRFTRMNAYKQLDTLYRLQENDTEAFEGLVSRINASPFARNNLKQRVIDAVDGVANGERVRNPDASSVDDLDQ